jgi:hypothetical protein
VARCISESAHAERRLKTIDRISHDDEQGSAYRVSQPMERPPEAERPLTTLAAAAHSPRNVMIPCSSTGITARDVLGACCQSSALFPRLSGLRSQKLPDCCLLKQLRQVKAAKSLFMNKRASRHLCIGSQFIMSTFTTVLTFGQEDPRAGKVTVTLGSHPEFHEGRDIVDGFFVHDVM